MWDLVERLVATLWMLRTPVALCALIFGGMAAINEVGSSRDRDAGPSMQNVCSGDHVQQNQKDPSC